MQSPKHVAPVLIQSTCKTLAVTNSRKKHAVSTGKSSPADGTDRVEMAEAAANPVMHATVTVQQRHPLFSTGHDIPALRDEINLRVEAVKAGSFGHIEGMLASQAISLDTIFKTLAQKASVNLKASGGAFCLDSNRPR